ncbi:MAG TPA: hypothetical protein VHV57_20080 [Acidimicrobiales bacterium]|jgi:hypothetical protein|nr:hypothetical protein [Acidimicrobiales bacterium]
MERLVAAFCSAVGTEAMISLTGGTQLDADAALEVTVTTCRWILSGALVDAGLR